MNALAVNDLIVERRGGGYTMRLALDDTEVPVPLADLYDALRSVYERRLGVLSEAFT